MTETIELQYPNEHLLVDAHWLEMHRQEPHIVLLDVRATGYEIGHISGAYWLDAKALKDSSRYTFASVDALEYLLKNAGVSNGSTIVVYDDGSGVLATRVFYVLEYYGLKDRVKILNGGYAAWAAASHETTIEVPLAAKGTLTLSADAKLVVTKEAIQAGLDNCILVDTRSALEYSGAEQRSNRKGGHISGAIHKEWNDSLGRADQEGVVRFKAYPDLKQQFETLGIDPAKTIMPYCQTNQRGAHTYFTLRLMGYHHIRPYEGSWDEWGNDEHTVVIQSSSSLPSLSNS
ncbi:sulfurtransferase [Bacillus sp. FJAT-28004]|uniref:sulfurtransferase n=1 Tax=Bacillus sp. FJAT-28004 TaxID=1679165 RepID=UPI0006B67279|nr:rhodanese-like domain-containing protein [Bacillus sp. FJAT-28004]